ncbi:MAG: hypothetical protein EPO22_00860 [Dehalococcoidia bacterium]|nr:MAG: hypothetical protein EPO22_00860 [Dehalococcoidia bacterium]
MSIRRREYDEEPRPRRIVDDAGLERPAYPDDAGPLIDEEAVADSRVTTTSHLESLPARVNAVLFALVLALEGLLAFRFALMAFGANRSSGFVKFIRDVSWPFVRPFDNAFRNRSWDQGIIEPSTLLAMGVYLAVFLLVAFLVNALLPNFEEHDASVVHRRRYMRG